jgi:cytochrome c peroxidase
LRNIAVSAPYMHDGSLETLEDVVEHYDRGGLGDPSTDPQIEPLGLSPDEKDDLVAFLHALTDDDFLNDPRFRP